MSEDRDSHSTCEEDLLYNNTVSRIFKGDCVRPRDGRESALGNNNSTSLCDNLASHDSDLRVSTNKTSNVRGNDQLECPSYMMPIVCGMTPYLLTLLFGCSEIWIEISYLLLMLFWLYITLKVPWAIHMFVCENTYADGHTGSYFQKTVRAISVMLIFISPFVSVYGINNIHTYFPDAHFLGVFLYFDKRLFLLVSLISITKYFFRSGDEKDHIHHYGKTVGECPDIPKRIDALEKLVDRFLVTFYEEQSHVRTKVPHNSGYVSLGLSNSIFKAPLRLIYKCVCIPISIVLWLIGCVFATIRLFIFPWIVVCRILVHFVRILLGNSF